MERRVEEIPATLFSVPGRQAAFSAEDASWLQGHHVFSKVDSGGCVLHPAAQPKPFQLRQPLSLEQLTA